MLDLFSVLFCLSRNVKTPRHFRSDDVRCLGSSSLEGDLFKASYPECTRCSGRQVYAASLYEWTAVIDSDGDASSA